jgi:ABC-type multidrug transport system fused ATPase/permease subunit
MSKANSDLLPYKISPNQLRYGLEGTPDEPSQEEIEAAARLANADKFIENMPQK